jgi:hypothetical protein
LRPYQMKGAVLRAGSLSSFRLARQRKGPPGCTRTALPGRRERTADVRLAEVPEVRSRVRLVRPEAGHYRGQNRGTVFQRRRRLLQEMPIRARDQHRSEPHDQRDRGRVEEEIKGAALRAHSDPHITSQARIDRPVDKRRASHRLPNRSPRRSGWRGSGSPRNSTTTVQRTQCPNAARSRLPGGPGG